MTTYNDEIDLTVNISREPSSEVKIVTSPAIQCSIARSMNLAHSLTKTVDMEVHV